MTNEDRIKEINWQIGLLQDMRDNVFGRVKKLAEENNSEVGEPMLAKVREYVDEINSLIAARKEIEAEEEARVTTVYSLSVIEGGIDATSHMER